MAVPIQLHPTREFYREFDILEEALDNHDSFDQDLASAIKALAESGSDQSFQPHGYTGHDFSIPINHEFLLVFRRVTDRDANGKALLIHFYLEAIELINN
jgi:hypothetical protein